MGLSLEDLFYVKKLSKSDESEIRSFAFLYPAAGNYKIHTSVPQPGVSVFGIVVKS